MWLEQPCVKSVFSFRFSLDKSHEKAHCHRSLGARQAISPVKTMPSPARSSRCPNHTITWERKGNGYEGVQKQTEYLCVSMCHRVGRRLGGMPAVLGGHVLETMTNMATKTWPCHPPFRHPQGVTLHCCNSATSTPTDGSSPEPGET